MKRIKKLGESDFLKLLFAYTSFAFLVAAICMPDRGQMLSGLGKILSTSMKDANNYFAIGGFSATFLNMALVGLCFLGLFQVLGATANNVSTLAFLLTLGFSSWGIHIVNLWPTVLGVFLYSWLKKKNPGQYINAMMFSTGIAPLVTELMLRHPYNGVVAYYPVGIGLALLVGVAIGFFLPAGLGYAANVHKGFDLYSAAVPVGMMAFFLQAIFFKTLGVEVPAGPAAQSNSVASAMVANLFCLLFFGSCILLALAMGCSFRSYWQNVLARDFVPNLSAGYGGGMLLMNIGIYGLFILAYYNLIGANFNAVIFGTMFCMLACCNSGSNPRTVLPIMLGYVVASFLFSGLSGLVQGNFSGAVNAQAIAVGLCFANGLSPISGKYGWQFGFLAAIVHYLLVTSVPMLHAGYCLYNGGFTAAFTCLLLVPIFEDFAKLRVQK